MIPTFYNKEDQYSTYSNNSQFFPVTFPMNVRISDSLMYTNKNIFLFIILYIIKIFLD